LALCVLAVFVSTAAIAHPNPSPDGVLPEAVELVQDGSDEEASTEEASDEATSEEIADIWCDDPAGCIIIDDSGSGLTEDEASTWYPTVGYEDTETIKVADVVCSDDGCVALVPGLLDGGEDDGGEDELVQESSGSGSGSGTTMDTVDGYSSGSGSGTSMDMGSGSGTSMDMGSGMSMDMGSGSGTSMSFVEVGSGDMVVPEESSDDEVEVMADVYCGSNNFTTGCQIITDDYNDANKTTEIHEGYEHVGVMGRGSLGGHEDVPGYFKDNGTETGEVYHAGTVACEEPFGCGLMVEQPPAEEESGSGEASEEEDGDEADVGDIFCTGTDCEIVIEDTSRTSLGSGDQLQIAPFAR